MSLDINEPPPNVVPQKQFNSHPLAPLTADEISIAAGLVQKVWPANTELHYKAVTLEEPPTAQVLPYLEAEHGQDTLPSIERKAFVCYYLRNTVLIFCLHPEQ
jgi:primary-amine oxidase